MYLKILILQTMEHKREISGLFNRAVEVEGVKEYIFTASTADPDRHRTVLNQNNWEIENYKLNPIIGYQHNVYGDSFCYAPNPDDVIGRGRPFMEDGNLMIGITFDDENDLARKIESKVERGFLNTVSVGFLETGEGRDGNYEVGEDPELYYFEGQELLEVSIVNIPSNPKAKKKSLRDNTYDALKFIYRELGGNYKFSEIESMKVRDVLDLLEGKELRKHPVDAFNRRIENRKSALTGGKISNS